MRTKLSGASSIISEHRSFNFERLVPRVILKDSLESARRSNLARGFQVSIGKMINRSIGNDSPEVLKKMSGIYILEIRVKRDDYKETFPVECGCRRVHIFI